MDSSSTSPNRRYRFEPLSFQGNEATLQWNWQWPGKEAYRMKASRNDGVWRIQYLQGFDADMIRKRMLP